MIMKVLQDFKQKHIEALSELGLRIVRFRNDEIERELSTVVGKVRGLIASEVG
jgi:very-short-patch-repair endonuclease